jgi:hypothetical protein
MCTLVVLRRPDHAWPVLIAANRDEMADRPWRPPDRHWSDRPEVTAGLDVLAGGTWFGVNDWGVAAGVLNRINTLGPAPGFRSRGELPLEALDHAEARTAAAALADLDPLAYRPFNMIIVDQRDGFWLRCRHEANGSKGGTVDVLPLPEGLSMLTAFDLNDARSPRIRRYLPRFRQAPAPDPDVDDWSAWQILLADRQHDAEAGPGGAMAVVTDTGFGTVSSALLALPGPLRSEVPPVWLFSGGPPGSVDYRPVAMIRHRR